MRHPHLIQRRALANSEHKKRLWMFATNATTEGLTFEKLATWTDAIRGFLLSLQGKSKREVGGISLRPCVVRGHQIRSGLIGSGLFIHCINAQLHQSKCRAGAQAPQAHKAAAQMLAQ